MGACMAFWVEGNGTKWPLGFVEGENNGNPTVYYMVKADTKGKSLTI